MPAGNSQLNRLRKRLDPLRARIEIFISGQAPSDPLYLTNRTWLQKLKLASLIAVPVLLLIALVTIGANMRLRSGKMAPYENPATETASEPETAAPAATQRPAPDPISASAELDVVNLRIVKDTRSPVVTGTVRNKTERRIASAEVSYYLADAAGSLVGTDTTGVANLGPHGSAGFRMPLKIAKAEYVFVRDVHPN
ncbi:MAG: FxLYD domain-containing protein [Bryobacteraceae bacterium]|jgi:hypothetical protein